MIAHLSGILLEKHVQRLVVDVGGVGYEVFVPLSTFYAVGDPGAPVRLGVHTRVTDDAIQLYGFQTPLERTLFERLIAISGVGPKVALAVLSGIETRDLVRAVRQSDLARLVRIPGIGRKTAERLVLELKDRLPADVDGEEAPKSGGDALRDDLLSALVNLGYQRGSVEKTVEKVMRASDAKEFETLLRAILKDIGRA